MWHRGAGSADRRPHARSDNYLKWTGINRDSLLGRAAVSFALLIEAAERGAARGGSCHCPRDPHPAQFAGPNEEDLCKMFLFIRCLIWVCSSWVRHEAAPLIVIANVMFYWEAAGRAERGLPIVCSSISVPFHFLRLSLTRTGVPFIVRVLK